ncbi:739_t:CDS:10 [Scutellospora calospora]|uniref:739_t:CDS:1 n=1 Tax=Scutellospora calospora TaxID=85575 RepID=A0ACA9L4K2_9GLOM|nr:739_t:CDS:10 [Scutellospora calospora]
MPEGDDFLHICYTSYHCYECRDKFKCKQRKKEFAKDERERLNKEDKIPICRLCNMKHFRCKGKKCDMCCKRNACDSYPCKYCVENELECKYTIIQDLKEFNMFNKFDLSAYVAQLEKTKEGKVHVQAYYKKMRGNSDENIEYVSKKYNRCEIHKKKKCRCDYSDVNDRCEVCNDNCPERTKVRIDGFEPCKFGDFRYFNVDGENENDDNDNNNIDYSSELAKKKYEEFVAIIEGNEMLNNGATALEVFRHNKDRVSYSGNYSNMGVISKDIKEDIKKKRGHRFWHPIVILLYGDGGSGKTGLVFELFRDFGPKPPEECYNFGQDGREEDSNKRNFRQFARRLNFVAEISGVWDDDIEKRTTNISFRKSPLDDDIKLRRGIYTIDEIVEKAEMFTENIEGEYFDVDGIVYWRRKFPDYLKRYLADYPKCKDMKTASGKTLKCRDLFKSKYIAVNTEKTFLRPKYLKIRNIKVINAMIHPYFMKIGESYFNKFNGEYIKFVYLETVHSMEFFNKELFDKNIDYIIKFNGKYDIKQGKVLYQENEKNYEFERGNEESLKELIRKEFNKENMNQETNNLKDIVSSEKVYTFNSSEDIENNRKRRVIIEKEHNKNWKPLVFYVFGRPGTGKTNFWSFYDKQEVVLVDEFQAKVDYEELIHVLDKIDSEVEESQGKFVPFLAKYVFLISSKSLYKLYESDDLFEDLYDDYYRLIDYVIEFDIGGKIKIHKGDKEKFFNMEWDVEFDNGTYTNEETIEKGENFTKSMDGEYFVRDKKVYWRQQEFDRFWDSIIFYFYGNTGTGKTTLIQILFGDDLYDKEEGDYWDDYEGEEIVFLDKYHKKIKWKDLMNLMNDNKYMVETEEGEFVPFPAKYIFITNRKSPEEAYELGEGDSEGFDKFEDRLDYIVEFTGKWRDNIEKRNIDIRFHKGSEGKFQKYIKNIKGRHTVKNGNVYWRPEFSEHVKKYLDDYPRCKELYEYIEDKYSRRKNGRKTIIERSSFNNDFSKPMRKINKRDIKRVNKKDVKGRMLEREVTKYSEIQSAIFYYDSENKCMVLGDTFEYKIGLYLKRNRLNPQIIKNYVITDGRLLMKSNNKSLRSGKVVLLDNGIVEGLEIINTGKYTIFGDRGIDIWCRWQGIPLLVQCKFRSVCDECKIKEKKCSHGYWKKDLIKDVKKFDEKLSEWKMDVFGIFVISEGILIDEEINNMKFNNVLKVVNFCDESKKKQKLDNFFIGLKNEIDSLGKQLLNKRQNMDWSISLEDKKRVELEVSYRSVEAMINDKIILSTDFYFKNLEKVLYYIRQAYNITSLNDICDQLDYLKIVL